MDDRLLAPPNEALGTAAIKFLEAKLAVIQYVVPPDRLATRLRLDGALPSPAGPSQ